MKVLIVDDNSDDRKILRYNFEMHGYEAIFEGCNGKEGFELAKTHTPDLIVSDALMPVMDGFQFLRNVKKDENLKSIPFIFYSAVYTGNKDLELAESLGAAAFIVKPVGPEEFWEILKVKLEEIKDKKEIPISDVLLDEEEEYLKKYSDIVATKLEEKVLELQNEIAVRTRAEQELRQSQGKLNAMLQSLCDHMRLMDKELTIIWANENTKKVYGDDIIGKKCYEVFHQRKEPCEPYPCLALKAFNDGKVHEHFTQLTDKKGNTLYLHCTANVALRDNDGSPEAVMEISRDITERIRAEELERAKFIAEAANKAKSQFIANLSHDIRTPINAIFAVLDFIKDTKLDDSQMNFINTVNSEAQFLFNLINDILDFSKIEAEKMEFEEIPFDLSVMIEDMAYSLALMAEKKGLEVISFVSPDIPLLIGDPSRLRQVLMNITSNALKFTNEGEIYIKSEIIEDLGDRVKLRISVKDTGIGIPKDHHAKIFDSFTQADVSTTRRYGGTGLGTTIAKKLTELMGGEIGLESEVGKGSTFWVTVILKKQKEQKIIVSRKEIELTDLKLLIVDPSKTSRLSLTEYLRTRDCKIVGVSHGKEALSMLRDSVSLQEPFDLVLINLQMTDMNGFALAKEIRFIDTLKEIPIIILTSAGNIGDAMTCKEIGINGYLTKPVRQAQLFDAIKSVLRIASEAAGESEPKLVTRHTIAEDSRRKLRILLTEDYPTNQLVAKKLLEGAGYWVDLAENGKQAVEAFKQNHYDLILMDVEMPVMNGYDSTRAIRDIETSRSDASLRIPIIAMTAHDMKSDKERCLQAGMDDFIVKPLKRDNLLAMVDKWGLGKVALKRDLSQDQPDDKTAREDDTLNFKKLLVEYDGDRNILFELLWKLVEDVRNQIENIHKALPKGNIEVVRREAHTIKGGASMLFANDLSSVASELEYIAKSGSLEGGTEILKRLEKEFSTLQTYIRKYEKGS